MKHVKLFEGFNSWNHSYFVKLFNEMYGDYTQDEVLDNMKSIISSLVDRAKTNLDSKPSPEKIQSWEKDISEIIENFIRKGHNVTDEEDKRNNREEIRQKNLNLLYNSDTVKEIRDVADYILKEVEFDTIIDFIKVEDGMKLFKDPNFIDFSKEITPLYDEDGDFDLLHYIKQNPKYKYSFDVVKNKLTNYFLRRVAANIPSDKIMNEEESLHWLKVYIQKFIYEYLIPMSKNVPNIKGKNDDRKEQW
jgi:hypothetical protein